MNEELSCKDCLDEKLMNLPLLAEVQAIEDRLDVSVETAMGLKELFQISNKQVGARKI
jgi:hypothetical protein